jgi:hypothetical protein
MSVASNLYAERVFAEHPITLWSLDDSAEYVSMVSENFRNLSTWTIFDGSTELSDDQDLDQPSFIPFANSFTNKLSIPEESGSITLRSPVMFSSSDINYVNGTVSVSFYTYLLSSTASVSISLKKLLLQIPESPTDDTLETKSFSIPQSSAWAFISTTFEIPPNTDDLYLSINIENDIADEALEFYINGVSVGQAAEVFQPESLGQTLQNLNSIALVNQQGVPASTYGVNSTSGYYLAEDNMFCAVNSSMPLVYGSRNSTRLIRNNHGPSMIFPGYGFMNQYGKHRELTFEVWLRVQAHVTSNAKRIIGPIASEDGLYVNDAFMTLRVGSKQQSYPVSEWDRPMLVAMRVSGRNASLVLNGEEVISFNLDENDLQYPDRLDSNGKEQDWIGIYCYADVPQIEIDCVGIYPYLVPTVVEKRRWVFGQGVGLPPEGSGSSLASAVAIDYSMANYAKNYLYPDIGKFSQGINENLSVTERDISLPDYTMPEITFSNKLVEDWYTDNRDIQDDDIPFISMRPNQFWNNTEGYILFNQTNIIKQKIKAFYGFFKYNDLVEKQILFYLKNTQTGDAFEIYVKDSKVFYSFFKFASNRESVIKTENILDAEQYSAIGIDIDKFVSTYGGSLTSFFGNRQNIEVYVGGNNELANTFSGRIYRVGFSTYRNFLKIQNLFASEDGTTLDYLQFEQTNNKDAEGFVSPSDSAAVTNYSNATVADGGDSYFGNSSSTFSEIYDGGDPYSILAGVVLSHIASYTLVPKNLIGNFIIDIAVNGYWQDYTPLSYLSKKIIDGNNVERNAVDFVQFNISYPEIKSFINGTYNTDDAIVRTYISFQDLKSSATISPNIPTVPVPEHGVIYPDSNWRSVKYEVVNDCIIYIPVDVDLKRTGIVTHVELLSKGISETPIRIKSIQLASQALNVKASNAVGTRYGIDIYPLTRTTLSDDYKARNPYSIYKGSTPHLYLTSNSGIRLRNVVGDSTDRKISIPINSENYVDYGVSGFQLSLKFPQESFPKAPSLVFEIESQSSQGKHIRIYAVADNVAGTRAKLYAINARTGERYDGAQYFVNGRLVRLPVIDINTWTTIGISFYDILNFSSRQGAVRLAGPSLFNNILVYTVSLRESSRRIAYRKWSTVADGNDWGYLAGSDASGAPEPFTWQDILFISTEGYQAISGSRIYSQYTGTDRVVFEDNKSVIADSYQYRIYKDVAWQLNTTTPV